MRMIQHQDSTQAAPGTLAFALRLHPVLRRLVSHRTITVAAIIVISIALRMAYFAEANSGPLVHMQKWSPGDMSYFDAWAKTIAAGDWLSRSVRPPLHWWHMDVAAEHARRRGISGMSPEEEQEYAAALWDRWCGGGLFYQDPLYPYLVAATYQACGPDARYVFVWQMLLGVLTNVLIYLVARKCFGDVAAIFAAVLAICYAAMMYGEVVLLRDTLITFTGLALAWLVLYLRRQRSARGWLLVGLAFGVACMLKATFILVFAGMLAAVLLPQPRRATRTKRRALLLCIGGLLGFSPAIARNLAVGVDPWTTASGSAPTFALSNAVDAGVEAWDVQHVDEILDESGGRLLPTVLATLKTHPGAANYLRLLGEKLKAAWCWYEMPDNTNFYYFRLQASVLRWMPISFAIVAPLALAGCVLAWPRWRRCLPLYALILAHFVVLMAFFVVDRFRMPMAAAMIPFAGLTMARLAEYLASHTWKPAAAAIAAILVLWLAIARPFSEDRPLIRVSDWRAPYRVYYDPRCASAQEAGNWQEAADIYAESLRNLPPEIVRTGPSRPARDADEAELASFYSRVYYIRSQLLMRCNRKQEAQAEYRRAVELDQASQTRAVPRAK